MTHGGWIAAHKRVGQRQYQGIEVELTKTII